MPRGRHRVSLDSDSRISGAHGAASNCVISCASSGSAPAGGEDGRRLPDPCPERPGTIAKRRTGDRVPLKPGSAGREARDLR
jgi:hypothetical protein